ncbi:MAG: hypothetical protein O7I42_26730, partial [Alphaproteobacteria bacterium]|nr:hypothetical protein [Alphaproteobacteria bacterium]
MTRFPRPDTVKAELARYRWLKEKLLEAHGDLDQETLADTLEGASTLIELLGSAARSQIADQTLVKALRARIEEMRVRLGRLEVRVQRSRALVSEAMEQADLDKITEPDF